MIDALNAQADQQLDADRAQRLAPPDWPTQRELGVTCDPQRELCAGCEHHQACEWQRTRP